MHKDKPIECVQHPGEILWLPEGWQHATANEGEPPIVAVGGQAKIPFGNVLRHLQVASQLHQTGKIKASLDVLRAAINAHPLDPRPLRMAASTFLQAATEKGGGDQKAASEMVKAARQLAQRSLRTGMVVGHADPVDLRTLCAASLDLNEQDVLESCRASVAAAPGSRRAAVLHGRWQAQQGRLSEAEAELRRAVTLPLWTDERSGGGGAQFHLGNVLMELRRFEEGTSCLRTAVQHEPDSQVAKLVLQTAEQRAVNSRTRKSQAEL